MNRSLPLAGLPLVALAAAACSGGSIPDVHPIPIHHTHSAPQSSSLPASSAPPSSAPASSSSAPVTPTPTATKQAGPAPCTTAQLSLSIGQEQGAAGTFYTPLVLTNTGGGPCTLVGFPGVSFLDSSGHQVGQSAARRNETPHTVKLRRGGQASALLQEPDPSAYPPDQCHKANAARLRVYPPNQYTPLSVTHHTPVCTSTWRATIGPIQPGDNPTT